MISNYLFFFACFFALQAVMKFPQDYPYSPPSFRFVTKMWHPNIYEVSILQSYFLCMVEKQ